MKETIDYTMCSEAGIMNSRNPFKTTNGAVVGTKKYLFFIPVQSTAVYPLFTSMKTHDLFQGVSVQEGLVRLIRNSNSVDELENSLCQLLENNEQCVHVLSDWPTFKFSGLFTKNNLRLIKSRKSWSATILKEKGKAQEFRTFYGR